MPSRLASVSETPLRWRTYQQLDVEYMSSGQCYLIGVASLHIVDGGKKVKHLGGTVNHSCGSDAPARRFKQANLAAVALVAYHRFWLANRVGCMAELAQVCNLSWNQRRFGTRVGKRVGKALATCWRWQIDGRRASVPVSGAEAVMRHMYSGHALHGKPVILAGDLNLTRDELLDAMQTTTNGREWGVLGNDKNFVMPCTLSQP